MTPDRDDHILDAFLEEALGGISPPDLSSRILRAWQAQQGQNGTVHPGGVHQNGSPLPGALSELSQANGAPTGIPLPPPVSPALRQDLLQNGMAGRNIEPPAPPVQYPTADLTAASGKAPAVSRRTTARPRREGAPWAGALIAASILIAGVAIGVLALRTGQDGPGDSPPGSIAQHQGTQPTDLADSDSSDKGGPTEHLVATPPRDPLEDNLAASRPESPADDEFQQPDFNRLSQPGASGQGGRPDYTPALKAGSPDADVIASINASLASSWRQHGLKPSPPATEAEWCRRTYLQIVGRIPTVAELKRFEGSRSPERRAELVDSLLASEEYARNWSTVWTNVLIGRRGGMQPDSLVNRDGMQQYLRDSLAANKPYDAMVRELISASGANKPGEKDFNGATNFVLSGIEGDATLITAKAGRIFLGTQVQCAQCHHHPSAGAEQHQFWELNAFFQQAKPVKERGSDVVRLADVNVKSDTGDTEEVGRFFQQRNGLVKIAYPVFVDGTAIDRTGSAEEVNRREELAQLVAQAPQLNQALVNRMWAHFMGYGFTRPIDDLGPHNAASHPELLDRLAGEFAANGRDLKKLMRWITLSDAFALSSKIESSNQVDDPLAGSPPLFTRYYTRQMRAEELYESLLLVAANAHGLSGEAREDAKLQWLGQFAIDMGTDEGEEQSIFDGSLPQSLMMMNGPLVHQAVSAAPGTVLHRVIHSKLPMAEKVDHLFLAAVARKPTKRERKVLDSLQQAHQADEAKSLQDLWWALLNSNEFILDH